MLSINTNLAGLIAQNSLTSSTDKLNQAIERMTTGFKINHASDNAANYAIATNMSTKINSYQVAEDNVLNGMNMVDTASGILDEINDRVTRLRYLQEQALNGTYGGESLKAINEEVNSLVDEIERLYQTAEYNGIKMLVDTKEDANGNNYYEQESFADENTTFEQLQISASSFNIHSQDGTLLQTYDVTATNTLQDFLTTLILEGFNANINNGQILISSNDGKYITGDLADAFGIETRGTSYVDSTEQSFNNQIPVTTESTTVITEMTTTTTSTTQTSTIYSTTTIETTTTTSTETITTLYTVSTETLMVSETSPAAYAMRSGASPVSETGTGFMQEITRRDTSTMTALSTVDPNTMITEGTYSISTTEELVQLAEMVNNGLFFAFLGEVVLADNIDLSSIDNWTPIGSNFQQGFGGSFDGNGYVISNLTINNSSFSTVGLFGYIAGAISNLGLENVNITGDTAGGIAACGPDISNCYVSGNINGNSGVGGLIGHIDTDLTITNCRVTGTIIGNSYVGGIIGDALEGCKITITSCIMEATVAGNLYVGGLVGNQSTDDLGERLLISNTQVLSESQSLNGVFLGKSNSELTVEIIDSTYNSYYDDAGITLCGGVPSSNITTSNVTAVDPTPPVTYTTAAVDTTLAELGVSDSTTIVLPNSTVTMSSTQTIEEFLEEIRKDSAVTNAELVDGVLLITTANASLDLTSGFLSAYNPTQSSSTETNTITTTQTIQVEQVTETPVTETIWTTTTSETTRTETLTTTNTLPVNGSTTFGELNQSSLKVTVISDGTKTSISLYDDTTFDDFYLQLSSLGIDTTINGNSIIFTGQGNSYIDSDNLESLLGLSSVSKTMGTKISNTESETLFAIEKIFGVYAPGKVLLQVGTNANSNSQIQMDVSLKLRGINQLRDIGNDLDADYLSLIDDIISTIDAKQVEFGAIQNRLESALEEISTQYENLVSSRSTIRDADIAEVSSHYIQQQILQQASATLMATANQSPAIALQLI